MWGEIKILDQEEMTFFEQTAAGTSTGPDNVSFSIQGRVVTRQAPTDSDI